MNSSQPHLSRALGLKEATAIVVGTIIGTGVFLKTGIMTQTVDSVSVVMLAWVLAGLLSMAGALTYAELGALFPKAGGEYVYLQKTYGGTLSFLYGWMRFWIGSPGSIAAYGVGAASFLAAIVPFAAGDNKVPVAIGFILFFTLVNCMAVHYGGRVQVVLTALKVLVIVAIIFGCLFLTSGSFAGFSQVNEFKGWSAFGAAMLAALWAYDGWNNLGMASGEVKNPQRNIPLALIIGVLVCIFVYCLVNLAYFYALPYSEIMNASSKLHPEGLPVATKAVNAFVGEQGAFFLSIAFVVSALGAMNGSILTSSRVPYAMATDGNFPRIFSYLSSKTHTPIVAILVQGIWASVLAASGTFDQLTDYVIFSAWLFYALNGIGVLKLRQTMKDVPRSYKVPGYPWVPIVFVIVAVLLLINTLVTSPKESGIGLVIILLGLPVYLFFFKKSSASKSA